MSRRSPKLRTGVAPLATSRRSCESTDCRSDYSTIPCFGDRGVTCKGQQRWGSRIWPNAGQGCGQQALMCLPGVAHETSALAVRVQRIALRPQDQTSPLLQPTRNRRHRAISLQIAQLLHPEAGRRNRFMTAFSDRRGASRPARVGRDPAPCPERDRVAPAPTPR